MLRFLTAGESHGPCLMAIIEGLPAGLPLSAQEINRDLARRQQGYGRGERQKIEHDQVGFLSGLHQGVDHRLSTVHDGRQPRLGPLA